MRIESLGEGMGGDGAVCREVTAIKLAVRDPNRVNVFVDGKFFCSLTIEQLGERKLKAGQVLSEEELGELKRMSYIGKVFQRTLEWVLLRSRSVKEVRDYLRRKTLGGGAGGRKPVGGGEEMSLGGDKVLRLSDDEVEKILGRLIEKKYLDDERFAADWMENRETRKGTSMRRLEQELRQKGVTDDTIEQVMAETSRSDGDELKKIIAKKIQNVRYRDDPRKLIQYLVRRGFDYGLVVERVRDARETD